MTDRAKSDDKQTDPNDAVKNFFAKSFDEQKQNSGKKEGEQMTEEQQKMFYFMQMQMNSLKEENERIKREQEKSNENKSEIDTDEKKDKEKKKKKKDKKSKSEDTEKDNESFNLMKSGALDYANKTSTVKIEISNEFQSLFKTSNKSFKKPQDASLSAKVRALNQLGIFDGLDGEVFFLILKYGRKMKLLKGVEYSLDVMKEKTERKGYAWTVDSGSEIKKAFEVLDERVSQPLVDYADKIIKLAADKHREDQKDETLEVNVKINWNDVFACSAISSKIGIVYRELKTCPIIGTVSNFAKFQPVWNSMSIQVSVEIWYRLCWSTVRYITLKDPPKQFTYSYSEKEGVSRYPGNDELIHTARFIPIFYMFAGKDVKLTQTGKSDSSEEIKSALRFVNEMVINVQNQTMFGGVKVERIQPMKSGGDIQRVDEWWSRLKIAIKGMKANKRVAKKGKLLSEIII